MTAQVQWFCNADEERTVLDRLSGNEMITVFDLDGQRMVEIPEFSVDKLAPWPEFSCLYLWAQEFGPLRWHESRPKLEGDTHRSFVMRFFAREHWDQSGLVEGTRLLDQELSPGLCYKRPEMLDGKLGPCTLIAPPSSVDRVGVEYANWVNRCLSWIRRRGKIVHDWRERSTIIPNPRGLLNTVYAFPSALNLIESGKHSFAIL
jgi:hypothetical protein